mmetsp:Transcript_4349/g.12565  ORF Transcript_4349/g.12565 Transcript_4349/m.12565 type:complete len:92 (+) Transcript_4349:786-1061(+)
MDWLTPAEGFRIARPMACRPGMLEDCSMTRRRPKCGGSAAMIVRPITAVKPLQFGPRDRADLGTLAPQHLAALAQERLRCAAPARRQRSRQ